MLRRSGQLICSTRMPSLRRVAVMRVAMTSLPSSDSGDPASRVALFPWVAPVSALDLPATAQGLEQGGGGGQAVAHRFRQRQLRGEQRPLGVEELDEAHEARSEEHTSELQSRPHLVCRLLLE